MNIDQPMNVGTVELWGILGIKWLILLGREGGGSILCKVTLFEVGPRRQRFEVWHD